MIPEPIILSKWLVLYTYTLYDGSYGLHMSAYLPGIVTVLLTVLCAWAAWATRQILTRPDRKETRDLIRTHCLYITDRGQIVERLEYVNTRLTYLGDQHQRLTDSVRHIELAIERLSTLIEKNGNAHH